MQDSYAVEGSSEGVSAIRRAVCKFYREAGWSPKIDFYYRDLYEAAKELLKNPKFPGKQYTEAEIIINSEGLREFGAFNTARAFESAQVYCGEGVSPISIILSSDATLIGKRGGAHPIISEFYTSRYID